MVAVAAALLLLFVVLSSSIRGAAFVSRQSSRSHRRISDHVGRTVIKSTYRYDIRKDYAVKTNEYAKAELKEEYSLVPKTLVQPPLPNVAYEKSARNNWNSQQKVRKLLRAGTLDIPRIFHSCLGLSSILVGLHHMVEVLIVSSFTDVDCGVLTILFSGCVHTLAGVLGIRRLNFRNEKEAARNAMFWPAPIQSLWLTSVSLTEWGQGSGTMLSIQNPLFIAFTVSNILLTVWQFSEIVRKTGHPSKTTDIIWFQKSSHNAILVEFSYLLWMQLQMGAVLYIMCFVPLQEFSAFMDAFPKMQFLLSNLALNTAFFNNLAIFVATLLRYKVVSKPNNYNIYVFSLPLLSSVWIVWKVLGCFFLSYNGEMSSSFISMMLQ